MQNPEFPDQPVTTSAEGGVGLVRRTVFFVSDSTGITAETFGNAILAQFEFKPKRIRLPFVDSVDKAHQVVRQINDNIVQ